MSDTWPVKPVTLKYQLGEMTLFSVRFQMKIHAFSFADRPAPAADPDPPGGSLPSGAAGFLLRSYPVSGKLQRIAWRGHSIRYAPSHYERFFIDLSGDFESYAGKFSAKSRSTVRRKLRRLAESCGGAIDWREYRTPPEMEEFCRLARQVSVKTYQRFLGASLPGSQEFEDEMRGLAERDAVRGYLLFHQNRPISYLYCPIDRSVLLYSYLGYDPEFADLSPGTILQWQVLERLFAEGAYPLFDFTEGQGPHKRFFATGSQLCADVYFFRSTLWLGLLVVLHSMFDVASGTAARLLERLGFKSRLKRAIRSAKWRFAPVLHRD